jgi:hypothetical protein
MKRLRRSYPEVDAGELLNDASLLMSEHMLQGRPAADVIDALERLFARHVERSAPDNGGTGTGAGTDTEPAAEADNISRGSH